MSGRSDIALSEAGVAGACRIAAKLAGASRSVDALYSSPRRRAVETAQPIAERIGRTIEIDAALDEIDFGGWTGRSFAELEADPAWRRWNGARATATAPGGESMAEAVRRAVALVEAVAARGSALLVTHCDIIRGIVCHYLGLGLDNLLRFDVDPASLTTLEIAPWGGRLVSLNEAA